MGQCAGNDANFEVCNIPDPSSKSIALYPLLGGAATPGGTWTDDYLSGGLNKATGVLNAQIIPRSGVYKYTYTVSGVSGCVDTSSTITVVVGGYSGVTGPNASACSDDNAFNLFQVFNGSYLSPQSNGTWFNNTANTAVSSVIDAGTLGLGTTQFTYSIPAIGSCPAVSSTAFVTVFKTPMPGVSSRMLLCDSDNLSQYSNLDLNSQILGEDAGGTWTDNGGTGQITFLTDHFIDVKMIYDSYGPGEYSFSYTVLPSNPICTKKTAVVKIKIEKQLDFTGATLVVNSDICEPEIPTATYSVVLKKGPAVIPNGQYYVTYKVSGPAGEIKTELLTFNNGVLNFPLDSKYFRQVGDFTVEITGITAFGSEGACQNIINNLFDVLHVYPKPVLDGSKLTINTVCQNQSALVQITGAALLADGTYDIVYNLTGSNTATAQTAQIVSVGGVSSFAVPSNFIVNNGNTVATIAKITNVITKCTNAATSSGTMLVNPLPNAANLKIVVDDYCLNKPVSVALSGLGTLINGTIGYTLLGANVATQTISLVVSGGNASFIIPSNLLTQTGSTTIALTSLVNDDTTCGIIISTVSDSFLISPIPNAPIAVSQQKFCETNAATIANLTPIGPQYQWFDSAIATTALASSAVLVSGNYYVREKGLTSLCLSAPTMVTVTINGLPEPTLNPNGQNFCGINQPTISDLSANTNVPASIVWYDAASNGNVLNGATLLQDNVTYYGFDYSTVTGCFSKNNLDVTVSLTDCPASQYEFFVADGFSPNGDGVNDTFRIPEIEFLYPDYSLEIYNRYGNVMFKGNKNKPNWDGTNSGSAGSSDAIAPSGVYFYIINFNKENKSTQQGRLYLNR
ncbi:gliding motility-associated C-terminal domain-containing protein [Flavobacterium fluvii]|uniref:gliding motility-associated C-terminal domain-containing protein n=1 Tax=Flavobacterium fluvii TaxID=468056 RepID=UPI001FCE2E60|nr:gliding motility-associated C-terminal domain-containing protein [Flavobacterium fluvii]